MFTSVTFKKASKVDFRVKEAELLDAVGGALSK